ncbi:MAG: hypothetical protein ACYCSJ_02670 [Acidimicrobiales bacterium]
MGEDAAVVEVVVVEVEVVVPWAEAGVGATQSAVAGTRAAATAKKWRSRGVGGRVMGAEGPE